MGNLDNLKPFKPGRSGNSKGRPKGVPNRKTILNYLLFEANLNKLGLIADKPEWFDKVKPRTAYEAMTAAQTIKSIQGDTFAFNSLNRALGEDDPTPLPHNPIQFINLVPQDQEGDESK